MRKGTRPAADAAPLPRGDRKAPRLERVMQITLFGDPQLPLRRACLRQGARSAGFQPASGQDGRAPRKRDERPEAGAAGPVPGGSRHNMHYTFQEGIKKLPSSEGWP